MAAAADEAWCRETFPQVMELVSPRLPQRDACALLSIAPGATAPSPPTPSSGRCIKLTDEALQEVLQKCSALESLNLYALSRCVLLTDVGVIAIAQGCRSLELLSLFGILGVTDTCLEALSKSCSNSLTTLDVNGCTGIKVRK
ncbi:hypothetical protein ACQ4PT_033195 [Festuca glaucescens]